jgi:hypothetical protein
MSKQTSIKYLLLILILLPFILNVFWSGTGSGWLYWTARFLGGIERLVGGALLIAFPMAWQRFFWPKAAPDRRAAILFVVLGLYFAVIGYNSLSHLANRWLAECGNVAKCLE